MKERVIVFVTTVIMAVVACSLVAVIVVKNERSKNSPESCATAIAEADKAMGYAAKMMDIMSDYPMMVFDTARGYTESDYVLISDVTTRLDIAEKQLNAITEAVKTSEYRKYADECLKETQ